MISESMERCDGVIYNIAGYSIISARILKYGKKIKYEIIINQIS